MDTEKLQQGAAEILNRLVDIMKNPDGSIHPQSFVCAAGSLTGYSCRYDIIRKYAVEKGMPEDYLFDISRDRNGKKYYFGEILDSLLVKEKFSLWGFVGGAVSHAKAKLPDSEGIMRYVSVTAGMDNFGSVRSAETGESPCEYLADLWKILLDDAKKYCSTGEFHILYGICLQNAIVQCAKAFNPTELGRIALESGVITARAAENP